MAAEVGHLELAHDYAYEAAMIDLRDLHHNSRDGLHMASLAGAWIALVAGFGGLRDHGGELMFDPALPVGHQPAVLQHPLARGAAAGAPSTTRRSTYSAARRRRGRGRLPPRRRGRRRDRPAEPVTRALKHRTPLLPAPPASRLGRDPMRAPRHAITE